MKIQSTFSDFEYNCKTRITRRELFLQQMNAIIPWNDWVAYVIEVYPKGLRGRKPKDVELMLRMYLLQIWFALSDEGTEDSIYDSHAMKNFLGIDLAKERVPDATTLLKFRHLLEKHNLQEKFRLDVNERLNEAGLMMHGGTIVDATIIPASGSTKNKAKARDPEMGPTRKGNNYQFGMKIHAGADSGTGYIHSITATTAKDHDITAAHKLIRENDEVVYGDAGYIGVAKRKEIKMDPVLSEKEYRIVERPSKYKTAAAFKQTNNETHNKASVRCKIEHAFQIVKKYFKGNKVIYRGIEKNLKRFQMLFASANLLMCVRAGRAKEFCMPKG